MLAPYASANRFPGAVSALLAWVDGDTDLLEPLVAFFCADALSLVRSLARDVDAGNTQAVCRTAHRLHGMLAHFGVPQLRAVVGNIEDYGRSRDLGPAAPLVDELEASLSGFCGYLAKKPWVRC